jgi:hypothetical protein
MNICIDIFMEDNSFVNKNIIVTNEKLFLLKQTILKELEIPIEKQEWYLNGDILNDNFNKWIKGDYVLFINNNIIEVKFLINNNINNIYVNKNITIKELKNILSIKNNIYIRNKLVDDNCTLNDYLSPLIIINKLSSHCI